MPKRRKSAINGNRSRDVGRKASPPVIIRPIHPPRIGSQTDSRPTSPPDISRRFHPLIVTAVALLTVGFAEFALIVGMESVRVGLIPAFQQTARRSIQAIAAPFGGIKFPAVEDAREILIEGTAKVPEKMDELERESDRLTE